MNKLELNWIGKYEEANHIQPEPRILLEKSEYSYQAEPKGKMDVTQISATYGNMLIHGDNLLALKSLQQEFSGKIKCIFCDPPYNTQSAFEHYDDGVEHSIWLHLMKTRLELLSKLLADDGLIFIEIDNRELHYLKVLMDEVFGRFNYRNSIIVKKGVKNVSIQFKTVEKLNAGYDTILMYSKNPKLRIPNLFTKVTKKTIKGSWNNHWRGTDRPTMRYKLLGVTPERGQWRWAKNRTFQAVHNYEKLLQVNPELGTFSQDNFDDFYQKYLSQHNLCEGDFQLVRLSKNGNPEHYIPPSDKILLSENWLDLLVAGRMTDFEHEKNEWILHRIIHWITKSGDIVLDSFLGSGTTAAVAHKMGRRWIGIELGEHAYTHCYPRLKAVCDGEQGGISKEVGWQGGGGFTFYELAPSLLQKDKFGNFVISKEYNVNMLAHTMAKHEGYTYAPDNTTIWKQGFSGENHFIFTTTGTITPEYLEYIATELPQDCFLLICAKSFDKACLKRHKNITIKQIPRVLLGKCEFGKTDYNLNVMAETIDDMEVEPDK